MLPFPDDDVRVFEAGHRMHSNAGPTRPPVYAETMRAGGWCPLSGLHFLVSSDKGLVWHADGKHRMASQAAAGVTITCSVLFTDGGSGDRNA